MQHGYKTLIKISESKMGRLSSDKILKLAIEAAILDRESFLEAVEGIVEDENSTSLEISQLISLRGKKLKMLSKEEHHIAMLALLYGEQWESTFADSRPGKVYEKKARNIAGSFRKLRWKLYGKNKFEIMVDEADTIDVYDIVGKRKN